MSKASTILVALRTPRARPQVLLWALIALGLVVRLYLIWQPIETLVARYVADDAFYYFSIARNIALGQGATFDGLAPTNGFHPLYLLLLVPIFVLSPDNPALNVHLSLTLATLFNVATAWPLYWTLRRLAGSQATILVSIAWLFNPSVISIALQGVESSVYVFLVAVSVWLYLNYRMESSQLPIDRRPVLVGIALSLTFLARSDAVFLIAAVLVDMLLCRKGLKEIAQVAGTIAVALAPWIIWNWVLFGTFVQVSGAAIYYSTHIPGASMMPSPSLDWILSSLKVIFTFGVMIAQPLLLILFALATFLHLRWRKAGERPSRQAGDARPIFFLVLYAVLLLAFYALVLYHIQFWYLLPAILVATIGAAYIYELVKETATRASIQMARAFQAAGVFVILGVLIFAWQGWEGGRIALYPAQYDGYRLAQWLASSTDESARVGSWNSGILGYFSGRTIVNLDGVVNNQVYQHVTSRRSAFDLNGEWEYVSRTDIDYITDYENILQPLSGDAFADVLREVHAFPSVTTRYPVRVFQIIPGTKPLVGVPIGTGY